jgi:hypothetical protein
MGQGGQILRGKGRLSGTSEQNSIPLSANSAPRPAERSLVVKVAREDHDAAREIMTPPAKMKIAIAAPQKSASYQFLPRRILGQHLLPTAAILGVVWRRPQPRGSVGLEPTPKASLPAGRPGADQSAALQAQPIPKSSARGPALFHSLSNEDRYR